jgi:hypothetical protein
MSRQPTALELAQSIESCAGYDLLTDRLAFAAAVAIEYAKIHASAALIASHHNNQLPIEDLEFTLSAYPLDLIS